MAWVNMDGALPSEASQTESFEYRVPDDVIVSYRVDEPRAFGIGGASDITGNALRLCCTQTLHPNDSVHLALRLPDPFGEIQLRGRVTAIVEDSKRRDAYEIELLEVDSPAGQQLARYVQASQPARLKK